MARDIVATSRDGGGGRVVGGVVVVEVRHGMYCSLCGEGKIAENSVPEKIRVRGVEHL